MVVLFQRIFSVISIRILSNHFSSYGWKAIQLNATAEEAEALIVQMLNLYTDFCGEVLVLYGGEELEGKVSSEEATYTIDAPIHDGKALQSDTLHNF